MSPPLDASKDYSGWGAPQSKTIEWRSPFVTASLVPEMSGLEFLRAIRDGVVPPPPIAALMGMRMIVAEPGTVVFECQPDEAHYNPIGVVHGGLVCTLADMVSACAVQTTLDRGFAYTSIDLNVSYLRAVCVRFGGSASDGSRRRARTPGGFRERGDCGRRGQSRGDCYDELPRHASGFLSQTGAATTPLRG